MKLSIIIVTWNVKTYLSDCIASILEHPTRHAFEIIVVDNASSDGTVAHLRERFPTVKIVANEENLGFAYANNQGAELATGEYFFILNPDTLLLPGTLDGLVDFMDAHPAIAMCGPQVLNDDRTIQRSVRNFPTWQAAFGRYSIVKFLGIFRPQLERWRCRDFDYTAQAEVEQLIGAAILVRRVIFEQFRGFDELFFMYYEEVDLCYRVKSSGLRVVFYPGAQLIHLGGKSSGQVPAKKLFMILQSLVRYLGKHTTSAALPALTLLFKLGVLALQLYECVFYAAGHLLGTLAGNSRLKAKCRNRSGAAREFLARYALNFLRS